MILRDTLRMKRMVCENSGLVDTFRTICMLKKEVREWSAALRDGQENST